MNYITKIKSMFTNQEKYDKEVSRLEKYTNYKEEELKCAESSAESSTNKDKVSKQIEKNNKANRFVKDIKQTFSQNLMKGEDVVKQNAKKKEDVKEFLYK